MNFFFLKFFFRFFKIFFGFKKFSSIFFGFSNFLQIFCCPARKWIKFQKHFPFATQSAADSFSVFLHFSHILQFFLWIFGYRWFFFNFIFHLWNLWKMSCHKLRGNWEEILIFFDSFQLPKIFLTLTLTLLQLSHPFGFGFGFSVWLQIFGFGFEFLVEMQSDFVSSLPETKG